jgi:AhpD family alkylhydroperoxidase
MFKKKTVLFLMMFISTVTHAKDDITNRKYGDTAFEQSLLSSNETNYLNLPKKWAGFYGSDSTSLKYIDKTIAEIVRLRVSQVDKCNYCIILHTRQAATLGISNDKISSISTWEQSSLFSKKEKAALQFSEVISKIDHDKITDAYNKLIATGFTQPEIEELTNVVILMNIWSRLFMVQGKESIPAN